MRQLRLVPLLAVVAVVMACGTTDGDTAGTRIPLEGTLWSLTSYTEGGTRVDVPDEVAATARFADGEVTGSGGCNTYGGSFTVDGDTISIGPVRSTLKACMGPAMSVEAAYFAALEQTAAFRIDRSTLTLSDADGQALLTFEETQEAALAGPTWQATGINNGAEAVVSALEAAEVTAVFAEDGTVSGSSGCNTYGGSYTVDGSSIAIGPLASTEMACSEPDGVMTQETQFLVAMERASEYRIDGSTLELRDDTGALQVSFDAGQAP